MQGRGPVDLRHVHIDVLGEQGANGCRIHRFRSIRQLCGGGIGSDQTDGGEKPSCSELCYTHRRLHSESQRKRFGKLLDLSLAVGERIETHSSSVEHGQVKIGSGVGSAYRM
jgi:hypothetical protein